MPVTMKATPVPTVIVGSRPTTILAPGTVQSAALSRREGGASIGTIIAARIASQSIPRIVHSSCRRNGSSRESWGQKIGDADSREHGAAAHGAGHRDGHPYVDPFGALN
jgi:hypothetical protein